MKRSTMRTAGWLAIAILALPGVGLAEKTDEQADCTPREKRVASVEQTRDAKPAQATLEIPVYVPPASRGSVPGRVGGGSRGGRS